MKRTSYSALPTDDLIIYALARDTRSEMEVELAQRLMVACQMMAEQQEEDERYLPHDAGRPLKTAS